MVVYFRLLAGLAYCFENTSSSSTPSCPDGDGVGAGGHRPRGFPAAAGKVVLHRTGPLPATENSGLATAWLLFWLAARREVRGALVRRIKPDADVNVAAPQPAHEVLARCR